MEKESYRILIIDSKDQYLDDDKALVIHPKKLHLLDCIEKNSFDKCIIQNTSSELLRGKGFFNIFKALKEKSTCELFIYQPILVMQELDASEIETSAKIGGFSDIRQMPYEEWKEENGKHVQIKTIKMTMKKDSNNKK